MTTTELKRYINENNKIEYVLEQCGCHHIGKFEKEGISHVTAALPDGDNPKGAVIVKSDYLNFYSYSRGIEVSEGKDIIDLVQMTRKCNFIDALKWLHSVNEIPFSSKINHYISAKNDKSADILGIFRQYKSGYNRCDVNDIKYLDDDYLKECTRTIHKDLFSEGIIKKTIDKFGLMYDWTHKRTLFVHHDWLTGKVVGVNGRTSIKDAELLGINKYYLTPGYNKANQLYGLYENRNSIESDHYITIFEAEKSTLKRDSRGDAHCVSISGKVLSSEQVRIILGLDINEVVIALDNDVDIYHVMGICERFYQIRTVSFIKDRHDWLGPKDSPADMCDKKYKQLFNERIRYNEKLHKKYMEWLNNK